jgi:hypothetical protein
VWFGKVRNRHASSAAVHDAAHYRKEAARSRELAEGTDELTAAPLRELIRDLEAEAERLSLNPLRRIPYAY